MKKCRSLIAAGLVLAALSPLQTRAAANTWNNAAGDSMWSDSSANWTSPTTWVPGDDAVFGTTGAGPISLLSGSGAILAHNLTFSAPGYSLSGFVQALTLSNDTPTITVDTPQVTIGVTIHGTNGLTVEASLPANQLILTGDTLAPDGNYYTGGTYVKSGTLVLQAANFGTANTSPYGADSIMGLDTNATLLIPGIWNGSSYGNDRDQLAVNGQLAPAFCQLNMTGGTLDLQNDPKQQRIPIASGSGIIVNSGASVQAGVQMFNDGVDHTFSGVIQDGNNGVLNGDNVHPVAPDTVNQGPGYQIGIVTFAGQQPGYTQHPRGFNFWTLSGASTYSGSTRIDTGAAIKLEGAGQMGAPIAAGGVTGPMRIYGPGGLELNGHNQTIALMTDGNNGGWISNSAPNSVSTFSFGYGNEIANRSCSFKFGDNPSTGAILALKKVATGLPYILPGSWTISPSDPTAVAASNCVQTLKATATCTYSGDTTVAGGVLIVLGPSAISPNSAYRLQSTASPGCIDSACALLLSYTGTANVRQLWIDGVQQPNGVYGSIGNSLGATGVAGIAPTSPGTLTVTGYAPVVLGATKSGNTITFSWAGVYKLQSKTNTLSGAWYDYPGGVTSPVTVPTSSANTSVFYRLSTIP